MLYKDFILQLLKSNSELTVKEILARSRQSRQMAHYAIRQLIAAKKIEKIGHPPKTIYRLLPAPHSKPSQLSSAARNYLQQHFLTVSSSGELLEGLPGFEYYCQQRSLPVDETFIAYQKAREPSNLFRDREGFIEGSFTLITTIGQANQQMDSFHFLDYDWIRGFGRSRLGTLLYYAKSGQNKDLKRKLMDLITGPFKNLLNRIEADAIAFIPPIIPREVQWMKFMETELDVPLPLLKINKICGTVAVPQQSLVTVDDRITNAENRFSVSSRQKFGHVLLLDDVVTSGATLNQVAAKIKRKEIAGRVTGLAVISSTSDYEDILLKKKNA